MAAQPLLCTAWNLRWEGAGFPGASRCEHPTVGGPDTPAARPKRKGHFHWAKVWSQRVCCGVKTGLNGSEDDSHLAFAQPAGLRRCWSLTVLSEQPDFSVGLDMHLFGEGLLAPPRREVGCVRNDRLVPQES